MHAIVTPLQTALTGDVRRPLLVLQAAVALLLLIAIANIATLVSSRAAARTPEIAVRTALGASARRVARQLVTESLVVAAIGGVVGVALASIAVRSFTTWSDNSLPRIVKSGWTGAFSRSPSASPSRAAFSSASHRHFVWHDAGGWLMISPERKRRVRVDDAATQQRDDRHANRALARAPCVGRPAHQELPPARRDGPRLRAARRAVDDVPLPMKKYMDR